MGLLPAFALPERFAAVACGVVALALLTCAGRPWRDRVLHRPALAALVLGFLVLCVASAAYSIAPAVSVIQLGGFVMLPLTLLALMCADPDARAMFLHHAAWWCGAALVAIALWGLVQVVFFPALLTGGQPRHPFNNPNVMAALLNVGFFVALGLFVRGGHRRVMAVLWGGMLVLLVMFLSLSSKGAGITFMVGLAMAVFLFDRAQIKARGPALLALGAVAIPLSLLQQSQSSMTPDEKAALKTQIETILDRARRVYPRHPAIPYNHAQTIRAIMPLDSDLALSLYLEALRLDPLYLPARTGAADLLRLTGRDDDAYKTLVAGLDWPYAAEFRILSYYKTLRAMAVERQDKAVIDTIDRLTAYHENRRLAARERAAAWRQIGGGVMDSP